VDSGKDAPTHSIPKRVLWAAWWRWYLFLHASYNYERMQGLGFAHTMGPVIEHLYQSNRERSAALMRHLVFFNSEPQFGALVPAVVIAMEEERASGADISDKAINGVKSGLMGPLAGLGDSLIQGMITPLLLSLGITLALQGRLLGPVLYTILISAIVVLTSRAFWNLGYRWGRAAVSRVLASGWIQALTEAAAVTGMAVAGSLIATVVHVSTPLSFSIGQAAVSVQTDVLDVVLRNLLPLTLTLGAWRLLERRVSSMRLIGALFVGGILATYAGLLGASAPPLFSQDWVEFVLGGPTRSWGMLLSHLWPALLAMVVAGIWWGLSRRSDT
jgi:PTS system mannose-specific IID component